MNKLVSVVSTILVFCGAAAHASTVTFVTPTGSTAGGQPVDASATFTTGAGTLTITLSDLEADPMSVIQTISDLDFTLGNGATTGTLSSSSGQEITVNGDGTYTLGNIVSTGWGLNNNVGGGLQLDALGFSGPAHLIIGPPGAGNLYDNANGSIAGNGPHNPFLNGLATFVLAVPGVTSSTVITFATFSFGTTDGTNVTGQVATPEPSSVGLILATGAAAVMFRRRFVSA